MKPDSEKILECVKKYLTVLESEGKDIDAHRFSININHSALFQRILEGGDLFTEPPPLSFSYP